MTREELEALREGWDFETKRAEGRDGRGAIPESVWETYSAMANTEGGVILLGADERADGSLVFNGIADIERVERDFWNVLQNRQKVSANVLRRGDVERVELDGRTMLLVHVSKASRAQRPVFLNGSLEKTYLRVHDGDRLASPEVARRMLADAQDERDAQLLDGFGVAELHPESIRRYRQVFAARRASHPFIAEDDIGFLRLVGALKQDRARRREGLSLGGLLMLGREEAIRDRLPHWHLSYRELPAAGADAPRWLDRVAPDGTWNANVFEFHERVMPKLLEGLKAPFSLDAGLFRQDETSPRAALREALVNTLIHADYEGRGGVRILREPAGYEFINPGLLLVSPDQLWRGGVSEPRNPVLQRLFGLIQLGEREGSGGPAIRKTWTEQHWQAPQVWEDVEHVESHLKLRQISLLPPLSVDALRTRWGVRFESQNELGRLALVTAHADGRLEHARLRSLSDAHAREITLKLQELIRRGFLVRHGSGHTIWYQLTPEQLEPGSEQSAASSEQSAASSEQSAASSEQSAASSEQSADVTLRKRGWLRQEQQLEALLAYCRDGWRTLPQIAAALRRTENTVRTKYLRPLLEQGAIEYRYPDNPNHPHQAYRTRPRVR